MAVNQGQDIEDILSTVDDTTFDKDDWNIVIKECSSLAAEWEHLSGYLGLSISLIDTIKRSFPSDLVRCWHEALKHWIRWNYNFQKFGLPSWRTLLEVVARVDRMLFMKLAENHRAVGAAKENPEEKPENGANLIHQDDICAHKGVPEAIRPKLGVGSDVGRAVAGEAHGSTGKCDVVPGKPCLTFPILDQKRLSKEEKEQLERDLYKDSRQIMYKFQELFSVTVTSLKERNVTVNELSNHLGCLGALEPTYKGSKRGPLRKELSEAKTVDDVMAVVREYSSFFNYRMLANIVTHVGGEQDKKNLAKYLEDFADYAKRKVFKCPCEVGAMIEEGHANMFVTLDKSYDDCTVSSLEDFTAELKRILNITMISLCRIEPGSVKLTFQIPHSVQHAIFPLSDEQEMALARLGIVQLSCGEYLFTNPEMENTERAATSDEEDSDSEGHDMDIASGIDDVSVMTEVNVKDEGKNEGSSVADSALGSLTTGSIATGATSTRGSEFSETAAKLRPRSNSSELPRAAIRDSTCCIA